MTPWVNQEDPPNVFRSFQICDFSFGVGVIRLGFGEAEIPLTGSADGFFCLRRHRTIPDEEAAGV